MQLVAVLRKCKMRVKLKDARETFAAKFPMHEHLWLDWISDTLEEASGGRMQYPEVLLLTQRALLDYQTASLWQQFLEYGLLQHRNVISACIYSQRSSEAFLAFCTQRICKPNSFFQNV